MKIFLDVGAHNGQTVMFLKQSKVKFDRVHCFEPAHSCQKLLNKLKNEIVEVHNFGFGKKDEEVELYMPGMVGASIYKDKQGLDYSIYEKIQIVKISDWIKYNIDKSNINIMKINVEGSEIDILEDLIETNTIEYFYNILVHLDVRKIPSQRSREWQMRKIIRDGKFKNICFAENVTKNKTELEGISYWLRTIGAHENMNRKELEYKYKMSLKKLSSYSGSLKRIKYELNRKYSENLVFISALKIYKKLKRLI